MDEILNLIESVSEGFPSYSYCDTCNLQVNTSKSKVVVFTKRKIRQKLVFHYNAEILEIVDDFSYFRYKI